MHKIIGKNQGSIKSTDQTIPSSIPLRGNVIVCRRSQVNPIESPSQHETFRCQRQNGECSISDPVPSSSRPNLELSPVQGKTTIVCSGPPKKKFIKQAQAEEEQLQKVSLEEKRTSEKNAKNANYTCGVCHKTFKHKSYFDYHTRTHNGERPHKCKICPKSFFERSKLNRHLSACHKIKSSWYHSEEDSKASRTCAQCGKTFSRVSGLQAHQLIHDKIRPFSCTKCEQKFSGLTALKNHEKMHIGEKNIICEICGKQFLLKKYLDLHLKTTHKSEGRKHKCSICFKLFHYVKDLKRHQLMHSSEKKFGCNLCKASFKRKDNFNRHLKLTHFLTQEQIAVRQGTDLETEEAQNSKTQAGPIAEKNVEEPPPTIPTPSFRQVSVIKSTHEFIMSISRGESQYQ